MLSFFKTEQVVKDGKTCPGRHANWQLKSKIPDGSLAAPQKPAKALVPQPSPSCQSEIFDVIKRGHGAEGSDGAALQYSLFADYM